LHFSIFVLYLLSNYTKMAKKRFTDIEIWDKEWYMELSPKHKCLMKYIFDKCDASGCWKPNWKLASLHINDNVTLKDLKELPPSQYEILENGKIFIPDFINFQYGKLSRNSPAHNPIFLAIEKNSLSDRVFNRVSGSLKEKEKEEEEEKEEDKIKETKFWFLKFYSGGYELYKNSFNGQSTTEAYFNEWKDFIDMIYSKKFEDVFECKFISPHDFAKLMTLEDFSRDKWESVIKSILSTGIKPEHNLYFRIPQFLEYNKKNNNGTGVKQIDGTTKFNAGALELLRKGKEQFAAIAGKQGNRT
jgi:hypothetical protein